MKFIMRQVFMIFFSKIMKTTTLSGGVFLIKLNDFIKKEYYK